MGEYLPRHLMPKTYELPQDARTSVGKNPQPRHLQPIIIKSPVLLSPTLFNRAISPNPPSKFGSDITQIDFRIDDLQGSRLAGQILHLGITETHRRIGSRGFKISLCRQVEGRERMDWLFLCRDNSVSKSLLWQAWMDIDL